ERGAAEDRVLELADPHGGERVLGRQVADQLAARGGRVAGVAQPRGAIGELAVARRVAGQVEVGATQEALQLRVAVDGLADRLVAADRVTACGDGEPDDRDGRTPSCPSRWVRENLR